MSSVKNLDKLLADGRRYWKEAECTTAFASLNYYGSLAKILEPILKVFLTPEMTVADIGCGEGRYTKQIAAHCHRITGYELSEKLLKIASATYPLKNGSYMKLDLENDAWTIQQGIDAIFLMGVLVTIHNHETVKRAIAKMQQALNDKGMLITRDSVSKGKSFTRSHEVGFYALYRSRVHFMKLFHENFTLEREIPIQESSQLQTSFFIFRKAVS